MTDVIRISPLVWGDTGPASRPGFSIEPTSLAGGGSVAIRARSPTRPDHRLHPANRTNVAGVPASAPSPWTVEKILWIG